MIMIFKIFDKKKENELDCIRKYEKNEHFDDHNQAVQSTPN
jgi:hypothetical protein